MFVSPYLGSFALLCSAALGKEIAGSEFVSQTKYEIGQVHEELMSLKMETWQKQRAAGSMEASQYPDLGYTPCIDGYAAAIPGDSNNTFRCTNIELYSFLSHASLGSSGEGSSSWGWTSEDGREFVAIGQQDGTAFAEINGDGQLEYLGRLPQYSVPSIWREIRGYKSFMIIGSEAVGHGIQIFDMTKLLTLDKASPVVFDAAADLTGHFAELPVGRTHNVVVNEELDYAVAVGAAPRNSSCAAGLIFIDLKDPSNPVTPGCDPQDGYVHDAQCLVYRGPDEKYNGRDICYGYNEDTLTIYDVTDKTNSTIISRTSYEGASYTHQGWVLDVNYQEFLVLDDELDEERAAGPGGDGFPVTFIWDIRSLAAPKQTGYYKSNIKSIDHNQYVIEGINYQSHYGAGLRVLDLTSVPSDPTGAEVCEIGYFDIYPEDDEAPGGGIVDFVGTWSSYAFFKSGYILINTIERGAFIVKLTDSSCYSEVTKRL
ncbi:hypothetical protein PVAG01_08894 [Phlyctema vagabunda]|uniref:Regulatory P domain-containing protein n=1 Tax=Phlyctema vagabunda TaxID=108571 RepID=A0ABR4PAT3_9HELO